MASSLCFFFFYYLFKTADQAGKRFVIKNFLEQVFLTYETAAKID